MTIPQTRVLVQHDVDLDVQLVTSVVRIQALDLLYRLGEAHGEVQQDVALVGAGGGAGELRDVEGASEGPVEDDIAGEENTAEWVEEPDVGVVSD